MANNFGGGFFNNGTPGSQNNESPERKGGDRPTTIISIPIGALHEAKGGADTGFTVYGNGTLGQVCVVGIVRVIDIKSTKINYQVEDSTGMIDVTKWASSDDDSDQPADPDVRENTYVKVMGTVKDFQGKRSIGAYHVSKLEDPNEITMHLLDAIYTYCRWTKGPTGEEAQNQQKNNMQNPMQDQNQQNNMQQPGSRAQNQAMGQTTHNEYTGNQNNSNDMDTGAIGGNEIQENVLRAIKMSNDESGMSVQTVMMQLGGKRYSEPMIREAIEWLSTEGHVYSTIDDDHFKSTDS